MPITLSYDPDLIAGRLLSTERRILLFGESGIGKSTLAVGLAQTLARAGRPCTCIGSDPGSPAFGVPGAVCLGTWHNNEWQLVAFEALCTLDSGRFRLPLVAAVRGLSRRIKQGVILVDAPGVNRGVAGAELLPALVDAVTVDTILVLTRDEKNLPLANELASTGCEVVTVQAPAAARHPGSRKRARQRTHLWDAYLRQTGEMSISLADSRLTGTPPPLPAGKEWHGRQVALLKGGRTLAMGEIIKVERNMVRARIAVPQEAHDQFLVRDACRNARGLLSTFKVADAFPVHYVPPPDVTPYSFIGKTTGPLPVVRVGEATAVLVNGIFGDPLLHLRFHNQKRSILFDLGEGGRLPARLAHQVTDVFISHAHIDHISGFIWLMRSRIGDLPSCRLFGPPGLSDHITGLINGIHWDRIGEWGPRFIIGEIHGKRLILFSLKAGKEGKEPLDAREMTDGLLLDDPSFKVWGATLAHGAIPVLAYAIEQKPKLNVRPERLMASKLPAGRWLADLKHAIAAGQKEKVVQFPDGGSAIAGDLANELLLVTPAQKLVYATDLSDTPKNREKLTALSSKAHILFCEAAFHETDKKHADRSGHLTGRGCGEIATAACVERLVPFHFSRRYEDNPLRIYDEVRSFCQRLVLPRTFDLTTTIK